MTDLIAFILTLSYLVCCMTLLYSHFKNYMGVKKILSEIQDTVLIVNYFSNLLKINRKIEKIIDFNNILLI